jgi:hypothetical protein
MVHARLADPGYARSLREFCARVGAVSEPTCDPHVLALALPGAPSPTHELREVANYLETWQGLGGCAAVALQLRPVAQAPVLVAA